jgi:hypothetical protein
VLRPKILHAQSEAGLKYLAIVAVVVALYFGRDVFVPMAVAVLLSFALSPLVAWLRRRGLPRMPAGITVVLMAFLGVKSRRTVTPGIGTLKCLIQLLFPGSSKGYDRRLLGPLANTHFRNEISKINPARGGVTVRCVFTIRHGRRIGPEPIAKFFQIQHLMTVALRIMAIRSERHFPVNERLKCPAHASP